MDNIEESKVDRHADNDGYERRRMVAEELYADAMAAAMEKLVIYRASEHSGPNGETFSEWLSNNLPSGLSRADGIGRIVVAAPGYDGTDELPEDALKAQQSWEELKTSGRPINLRTITEIAKAHGIIMGKWLFYTTTGLKVNHLWSLVARGVVQGCCGRAAFVSPYDPLDEHGEHVICVYNDDFTDYEQVMNLEQTIRSLGIKCPMNYKPNIYSILGIYRGNEWGLRPSIYRSVYDIIKGCSKVTEVNNSLPSQPGDDFL